MRFLRPLVFVVFVVCCAIVTSVSVWNLSIVDSITSEDETTVKQIDAFLIFLGASGLALIFPTIFFELLDANIFLGKVWFELLWVGLYGLMYLAGASATTAQYSNSSCGSNNAFQDGSGVPEKSPCLSAQLLQAFTWIAAIFLIVYFAIFFVVAAVKHQEDKTIWKCNVRRFEWLQGRVTLKSNPASPSFLALPRFNAETPALTALPPPQMAQVQQPPQPPVILAPRPRPLAALRNAVLSYRSGLSSDYDVEQFKTTPSDGPPVLGYGYQQRQTDEQRYHQRGDSDSSRFTPSGFSHQPDSEVQQHQRNESESSRFTPSGFTHTPVASTVLEPVKPPPEPVPAASVQRPMPPVPAVTATEREPVVSSSHRPQPQTRQLPQPVTITPFYSATIQQAIAPGDEQQVAAPATYTVQQRPQLTVQTQTQPVRPPPQNLRPLPPSPPPLGDWPRLDATSKPRVKRKLPQPVVAPTTEPETQPAQMTEMQKQKAREQSQPEAGPSRPRILPEPLPRIPSGSGSGRRRSSGRYQLETQPLGVALNALSEDEPVNSWSQPQQSQPQPRSHQKSSAIARESISSPVDPVALSAALSSLAEPSNKVGQGSSSKPSGVRGPRQSVLAMIAGPSRKFS